MKDVTYLGNAISRWPRAAPTQVDNVYAHMKAWCCYPDQCSQACNLKQNNEAPFGLRNITFCPCNNYKIKFKEAFFLFLTHNVHFLLWVPAVSGINFQNKENGLCSWRGESLGLTCIRLGWRREEISWILFGYFSVTVGGLCGRNLTLFCLPVVCLNRGVAAPRKARS